MSNYCAENSRSSFWRKSLFYSTFLWKSKHIFFTLTCNLYMISKRSWKLFRCKRGISFRSTCVVVAIWYITNDVHTYHCSSCTRQAHEATQPHAGAGIHLENIVTHTYLSLTGDTNIASSIGWSAPTKLQLSWWCWDWGFFSYDNMAESC